MTEIKFLSSKISTRNFILDHIKYYMGWEHVKLGIWDMCDMGGQR